MLLSSLIGIFLLIGNNLSAQNGLCSWFFSIWINNTTQVFNYYNMQIDTTFSINNIPSNATTHLIYHINPGSMGECVWSKLEIFRNGILIYNDSISPPQSSTGSGWDISENQNSHYEIFADFLYHGISIANLRHVHFNVYLNYNTPNGISIIHNANKHYYIDSESKLVFENGDNSRNGIISYYDILGGYLYSEQFSGSDKIWKSQYSFRDNPTGVYFWKLDSDGEIETGKFGIFNH